MSNTLKLRWVAGALSLVALWMCSSLLSLHAGKQPDLGLLSGVCGESGDGCASVVNGQWGVFPPGDGDSEGPYEGIPVAAIGFVYYALLAAWYLLLGAPDTGRAVLSRWMLWFNGLGVLGSVIYIFLMLQVIGDTCGLCLISHVCNVGIFAIAFFLRPVGDVSWARGEPSLRLLLAVGVIAILGGWIAQLQISEGKAAARFEAIQDQTEELKKLAQDVEKVESAYRAGGYKFGKDDVRKDDPKKGKTKGSRYQLVIFSDIQCSNCARFEEYLDEIIMPIFKGHLEIVWKHYPNTSEHKYALAGASALEAARLQGKFWEMREYLFERRSLLGSVKWAEAAQAIGAEPGKFTRDMSSPGVRNRINEDVALGRKAGVRGTPGVFLNRRVVSRLMRKSPGFWEIQADSLRRIFEENNRDW